MNGEENQRYRCRTHYKTNFSCTYFTLIQKHVFSLVTWWALSINRKVLKIQSIAYTSSSSSPCFLQVNSRKLSSVIKWKDKWCRTICRTFKKRLSIFTNKHTHIHIVIANIHLIQRKGIFTSDGGTRYNRKQDKLNGNGKHKHLYTDTFNRSNNRFHCGLLRQTYISNVRNVVCICLRWRYCKKSFRGKLYVQYRNCLVFRGSKWEKEKGVNE